MAKAKAVELSAEASGVLRDWFEADQKLDAVKKSEFELRNAVILKCGFDPKKIEGSETLDIGNGYKLKASKKINYTLTNKNGETIKLQEALGAIQRQDLAGNLVQWKPEMSETCYKKELLPLIDPTITHPIELTPYIEAIRTALAAALTVKPGAPQLEALAPDPKIVVEG